MYSMKLYLITCMIALSAAFSIHAEEETIAVVNILNFPPNSPNNPYYTPPPRPKPIPPPAYIDLLFDFPEGDSAAITVRPQAGNPFTIKLTPLNKQIQWQSRALSAGRYEVSFTLPEVYAKVPPQNILLSSGNHYKLSPKPRLLPKPPEVRVSTNIPEAIFLLRSNKTKETWKGEGKDFSFKKLPQGSYVLSFSTNDTNLYIAPPDVKFNLNEQENKEIKANFQIAGKLTIKTNLDHSHLKIEQIDGKKTIYQEEIPSQIKTIILPEGRYKITLTNNQSGESTYIAPDAIEAYVKPLSTEEFNLIFRREETTPKEKQKHLTITSNISSAGYTINAVSGARTESLGRFSGRFTEITLPKSEQYVVTFEKVPGYETPETQTITTFSEDDKIIQASYKAIQQTSIVSAGPAIIGDPNSNLSNELGTKLVYISEFAIGIYEVTNAQYAAWLTDAIKTKNIAYVDEADLIGQILDKDGHLLFKTFAADPYSQIAAQKNTLDGISFLPIPGKDLHPVINVTWYGALAYCKDNNSRLPTEAEWEKAAGMALSSTEKGKSKYPGQKYIFGFSQDTIDNAWANYKSSNAPLKSFRVLTTPVGFYNGINILPLSSDSKSQKITHHAISPYGAYDMSGNVWEWVSDWYADSYTEGMSSTDPTGPSTGTQKVAKGGCYDSLADGVRVSERISLPQEHADAYTGFRIVVPKKG